MDLVKEIQLKNLFYWAPELYTLINFSQSRLGYIHF